MPVTYPFDPTGLAQTNLIPDEPQILTETNDDTYRIIIPDFAPFYQDNFALVHYEGDGASRPLINGIDYTLVMPYVSASRSIGKNLFGAVAMNTKLVQGHLGVTYRCLGGPWVADKNWVLEQLIQKIYNPRVVFWDQITNVQQTFPPVNHSQDYDTIYGQRAVIDSINNVIAAILAGPNPGSQFATHPLIKGNPHGMVPADIDLGNVPNLPLATQADIAAAASVEKFVSLKQLVDGDIIRRLAGIAQVYTDMATASSAATASAVTTAQQSITKDFIGLGSVENVGIATDAEVLAKDQIKKLITLEQLFPLLTRLVPELATVDDLRQRILDSTDTSVARAKTEITKDSLDLGDVSNLPIASPEEIADRSMVNHYVLLSQLMTILREDVPQIVDVMGIYTAIEQAQQDALTAAKAQITANSLGLGLVVNLPLASPEDISTSNRANKYVTLSQVLSLFDTHTPNLTSVYDAIATAKAEAITQAVTQSVTIVNQTYKPELLSASDYFFMGAGG